MHDDINQKYRLFHDFSEQNNMKYLIENVFLILYIND